MGGVIALALLFAGIILLATGVIVKECGDNRFRILYILGTVALLGYLCLVIL